MTKLTPEEYYNLTDEELDELYRPKKANSRKSLAPLFVYLILKEHTDMYHPYTQNQIIQKLEEYPYEISIERKAVGRILHNLEDSGLGIRSAAGMGSWYDKDNIWVA